MPDFTDAQQERDAIFALLACAAVAKTWDTQPLGKAHGHNIGAVLVDKKHRPIAWERNQTGGRRDLTEHAELRLIRGFIAAHPERTELHKMQIYTTLEPCAMCAGMMTMTNVRRVVYAQRDPLYGGVFTRLAAAPQPYPKQVEAIPAPKIVRTDLEASFAASGHDELIHWLPNKTAQTAYRETARRFDTFAATFDENAAALAAARHFLATQIPPP